MDHTEQVWRADLKLKWRDAKLLWGMSMLGDVESLLVLRHNLMPCLVECGDSEGLGGDLKLRKATGSRL
jgi:hypothetical protein